MRCTSWVDFRKSKFHETALLRAVIDENPQRVQELLQKGANPNLEFWIESQIVTDNQITLVRNCFSILNFVSSHKTTQIAELLLQYNARINWPDRSTWTALHDACMTRNKALADFLVDNGADTNIASYPNLISAGLTPAQVWLKEEEIAHTNQDGRTSDVAPWDIENRPQFMRL